MGPFCQTNTLADVGTFQPRNAGRIDEDEAPSLGPYESMDEQHYVKRTNQLPKMLPKLSSSLSSF